MGTAHHSFESQSIQDVVRVHDGATTYTLLKSALNTCFSEAMDKATIVTFHALARDDEAAWPDGIDRADLELLLQLQAGAGGRKRPAAVMEEASVAAPLHPDHLDLSVHLQEPTSDTPVSVSVVCDAFASLYAVTPATNLDCGPFGAGGLSS
jgi:hypothetical protein